MPEIFQLGFMVRAFIAGGILGLAAPAIGVFLVLRRLSLVAETLAHVAITGAAIGILLGRAPVAVALVTSATAAILLERLRSSRMLSSDSALALILYTALALALVFISIGGGPNVNLVSYLFGSIVTVSRGDVWATVGLGLLILGMVWLLYSELLQTTFDADLARVAGVPVQRVNLVLAIATGLTVTLSMRIVGGLLVGALIVFPVLASLQLRRGFRATLAVSSLIGIASVFTGLAVSFYFDISASGAIVLTALGALLLASGLRRMHERPTRQAPAPAATSD